MIFFSGKNNMEYKYLIGHRIKAVVVDNYSSREYIGYVSDVIIKDNREKIFVIEDNEKTEWFIPRHPNFKSYSIKIIEKKYTKFTRFEIMDI